MPAVIDSETGFVPLPTPVPLRAMVKVSCAEPLQVAIAPVPG